MNQEQNKLLVCSASIPKSHETIRNFHIQFLFTCLYLHNIITEIGNDFTQYLILRTQEDFKSLPVDNRSTKGMVKNSS